MDCSVHYTHLKTWGAAEADIRIAEENKTWQLGRVLSQSHELYRIMGEDGEVTGTVSGVFRYEASALTDYPATGDFVLYAVSGDTAVIHRVLPRRSAFARPVAGKQHELQIVAANVDAVLICMSLNENYNLGRLERYLAVAWSSKSMPVVVLTKADLCEDLPPRLQEVEQAAAGVQVLVTSALNAASLSSLRELLRPGMTASFIGSSGVGKSTLINALAGEERMRTSDISGEGARGRHTTTHRELMLLPGGVLVIDTPGMRAIGVDTGDADAAFEDIDTLAEACRFRDCTHTHEPGCAVRRAVEEGSLDEGRLQRYLTLRQETARAGMSARGIEQDKIQRMFGGKNEKKRFRNEMKRRNR